MNEFHRQLAVEYFNETWNLLDMSNRTVEQDARMIHLAHTSLLHWSYVGTPKNSAIGEWQVSRVHAVVNHADAAEFHARRSLEIAESNDLGPFLVAYAHEALARSMAEHSPSQALAHRELAVQLSLRITESESRQQLLDDLQTIRIEQ